MLIVAVCAVAAGYVIAGYPLLLGLLARRAKPVTRVLEPRTVTAIIPVRDGEHYLRAKLESILALDYPPELLEILVVSDGSTDGTDSIAGEFAGRGVRLLRVPAAGKPAALNAAIPQSRAEILLLTDVRQTLEPSCLRSLIACFADPSVGAVSATLRIRAGASQAEAEIELYWRYETWIRDHLARIDSMFGATGPCYALRRSLAVPMPPETLLDDVYLPLAGFSRATVSLQTRARLSGIFPLHVRPNFAERSGRWRGIIKSCVIIRPCWVRVTGCGCISFRTSSAVCSFPGYCSPPPSPVCFCRDGYASSPFPRKQYSICWPRSMACFRRASS